MKVDLDEVVLFDDSGVLGDTFIFEPSRAEQQLGRLLVSAEIAEREGTNRDLLDTVVHALQREYYRDPRRGVLVSFESALHQANLVLHDIVEQGERDWMGSFHAAVGVLVKTTLHVSTAGDGMVLMARGGRVTCITTGLSHSPITDPLRTFAQVASGVIAVRDVLFFGTSEVSTVFRQDDLRRLVINSSAGMIATRLKQLYEDQHSEAPLAVLVASLLPEHAAYTQEQNEFERAARPPVGRVPHLAPRQPLAINNSLFRRLLVLSGRLLVSLWHQIRQVVWPIVKRGSQRGGAALYRVSRAAGRNVTTLTKRTAPAVKMMPKRIWAPRLLGLARSLPRSSKIFALVALVLAASLVVSLVLLQKKRTADAQFQQASELLHEARTKKEAADTALIYDNRDQARALLRDAETLLERIEIIGLYHEQTSELRDGILSAQDRLDKVTRITQDAARKIGDFAAVAGSANLSRLFYLDGSLYSYSSRDNTIVRMDAAGAATVVSQTSQGIGFFVAGTIHEADKSLVLITDSPGAALYDTKTQLLQKQEISLPSGDSEVLSVATFGNRIYVYDRSAANIYGYSKTLRGYSGGDAWITDSAFPRDTVTSIGVDGYIYTLHQDGSVRKLLKGAPVEFTLESIEPALSGSARLLITENLDHIYILDPPNQRVAIFDTLGNLNRQVFLGDLAAALDIAVDADETTLYVLDGTTVWAVSLLE
jgi:hypothetical protein